MRLPTFSFLPIIGPVVLGVLLSSCAVGPNESAERGQSFWNIAAIFSSTKEKQNEEVTTVDDPSADETPNRTETSYKDIPLIGPILAALFSASPNSPGLTKPENLPGDEELAVDAKAKTKKFRLPLRLARLTEDHLLDDRKAPLLKVFHVKNGRLHAFSSPVTIRGIAEDANGIVSLKINGKPVRMRSRVFSKKLYVPFGEHRTLVEAEDAAGNIAYFQFKLVRKSIRQNAPLQRPGRASHDIKPVRKAQPTPRLSAMKEPGVYMVLMAGSAAAHIVKMPNLKQCREAVQFSSSAACTYHAGTKQPNS